MGNPGVGKSTLGNRLAGQGVFKSGLNLGGGLTLSHSSVQVDHLQIHDVPGLLDVVHGAATGSQIRAAFGSAGRYKLVFVCTLEAGRVRPQDVAAMDIILDALPGSPVYGVMINKLSPQVVSRLADGGMDVVIRDFNSGRHSTPFFFISPLVEALLDADESTIIPCPTAMRQWIDLLPSNWIQPEQVGEIRSDQFAARTEGLERRISELRNDLQTQEEENERQRRVLQQQLETIGEDNVTKAKELLLGFLTQAASVLLRVLVETLKNSIVA